MLACERASLNKQPETNKQRETNTRLPRRPRCCARPARKLWKKTLLRFLSWFLFLHFKGVGVYKFVIVAWSTSNPCVLRQVAQRRAALALLCGL